jgi:hypothetical protein
MNCEYVLKGLIASIFSKVLAAVLENHRHRSYPNVRGDVIGESPDFSEISVLP